VHHGYSCETQGFGGCFDVLSAAIGIVAAMALFCFKVGVMSLLAGSDIGGLVVSWLSGLLR
jgi:chromate transporter